MQVTGDAGAFGFHCGFFGLLLQLLLCQDLVGNIIDQPQVDFLLFPGQNALRDIGIEC